MNTHRVYFKNLEFKDVEAANEEQAIILAQAERIKEGKSFLFCSVHLMSELKTD